MKPPERHPSENGGRVARVVAAICFADALAHEATPLEKAPVLTASQWETIQGNRLLSNYRKIAAQEAKTLSG